VLVQTNHGGILQVAGLPVGERLRNSLPESEAGAKPDGSCMIVVATDAPLDSRNLERLARRALLGIARTGGYYSNGSGITPSPFPRPLKSAPRTAPVPRRVRSSSSRTAGCPRFSWPRPRRRRKRS